MIMTVAKLTQAKKVLYNARIIPMRGSWLDFEFDHKDILYVRIDRRRKMPATILFKAMGLTKEEILNYFYDTEQYKILGDKVYRQVKREFFRRERLFADVYDKEGNILFHKGSELNKAMWAVMVNKGVQWLEVDPHSLEEEYVAQDIVDQDTGEVLTCVGDKISHELIDLLSDKGEYLLKVFHTKGVDISDSILKTLEIDKTTDQQSAQVEIYRRLRPSSPPTPDVAKTFF